jgi:hypothetical protein
MSTNVIPGPGHIPSKDDPALMKAVIEADLDRAGVCLLPCQRARIRALKPDDPHGDDLYYVVAPWFASRRPWIGRGPTWLPSTRPGSTTTTPSRTFAVAWPTPTVSRSPP